MLFTEVRAVFRWAVITHTEYCGFILRFSILPRFLPVSYLSAVCKAGWPCGRSQGTIRILRILSLGGKG